ncbi:tyrosine-type recombinase/integrase [Aurantimonas aggregata]|uniref:Tyrosine-type recombinase/integrase n=1 Tax=Aurantimonas aggregata TaxID=2047720 RepID=A0A6L9MPV8_9HYPH|nr:tyrosine-type recombinase/integrase [Aurantimonas aggregata]NDV89528.1 tyrosine-type recombinase/integrase [Aurantimonas aggregata]
MLSVDVERYIALRRALGYKLVKAERHLRAFACFAESGGESHIRTGCALDWLAVAARTPGGRERRLTDLVLFARFLRAEDLRHEVPRAGFERSRKTRPIPYIYTREEIARILDAAGALRPQKPNPLRSQLYVMLFGLIAATGLRLSEALTLRLDDVGPEGVLRIRETKFRKSRLVPLHATVVEALRLYLDLHRRRVGGCGWLFPSTRRRALCSTTVNQTFRSLLRRAAIAPERRRRPRIHDLRHTFATRALEQCAAESRAVARHFVALSTYLGHSEIRNTYWYLQATPEMMADIATAAEGLVAESAR